MSGTHEPAVVIELDVWVVDDARRGVDAGNHHLAAQCEDPRHRDVAAQCIEKRAPALVGVRRARRPPACRPAFGDRSDDLEIRRPRRASQGRRIGTRDTSQSLLDHRRPQVLGYGSAWDSDAIPEETVISRGDIDLTSARRVEPRSNGSGRQRTESSRGPRLPRAV